MIASEYGGISMRPGASGTETEVAQFVDGQGMQLTSSQIYSDAVHFEADPGATLTVDWDEGNVQTVRLSANCTITNNGASLRAGVYGLAIWGDETTNYTVTISGADVWTSNGDLSSATTVNADQMTFVTFTVVRNQGNTANRIIAHVGLNNAVVPI